MQCHCVSMMFLQSLTEANWIKENCVLSTGGELLRKGFWSQVTSPAARCSLYHRCLMKIVFFAGYWNRGIITTSGGQ